MELELIDFVAQMINNQKAKEKGYAAAPRWLCTREDLQQKYKSEALRLFEEWAKEELEAKKSREELIKI